MRKMSKIVIMVCITAMILINLPNYEVGAEISGTAPSEAGDTLIGNVTVWKDEVITLNGNLTVNETGNLTLDNVTLLMNCTKNGSYHIEVQAGGEMYILNNSNIRSANEYRYLFWVKNDSNFEMRDSELSGCGFDSDYYNQGLVIEASNVVIENSAFSNNYNGIILSSSNNSITNCMFYNNHYGIYLHNSSGNIVKNCVFSNNNEGIHLFSSSNNEISNCYVSKNPIGIHLSSSDNNKIADCVFDKNDYYGIILFSSHNNNITGCVFCKNNYASIYLSYSSKNTISSCTSLKSVTGIHFSYYSNNNIVKGCNISDNVNGINITSSSNSNFIYNNTLDNVNNAYDECTNYWNSSSNGNYWSDYNGTDEYSIPGGNNKDSYPSGIFKKETKIEEGMPIMYPVIICIAIILVCIMLYGVIETKTIIIRCPACGKTIRVKKKVRPFNLECKHCGRKGVLR